MTDLEPTIRACAKEQRTAYTLGGVAMIASGVLLGVLSIFVEGKPGEEAMRIGAGVLGVVLVVAGGLYLKVMIARVHTLVELLLTRRAELREPTLIAMRRAGVVISHAITVRDSRGTKYRMRVPAETDARRMLEGIARS
jgi:drug/metabolite transporter (DMT)-like permease